MVNISFSNFDFLDVSSVAVMVYEGKTLSKSAKNFDGKVNGVISKAIENEKFSGKVGEVLSIYAPYGLKLNRILCVGVGKLEEFNELKAQSYGAKVGEVFLSTNDEKIKIFVDDASENKELNSTYVGFGAYLATIRNYDYKTDEDCKIKLQDIVVACENHEKVSNEYKELEAVAKGVELVRKLVSMPANDLTPCEFAKIASTLEYPNLKVKVMSEKDLKKLGMDMMLSVGNGSENESKMVVFEYKPKKDEEFDIALIGKGVCFDTGGISLKPSKGMEDMKFDMAGAGAVIGTIKALSERGSNANVLGVMGLVENMPSGKATRPGDVVKSMSGKTVEIINTDAEGRLVLGDLITFAQKEYKVKKIIDLATLTGAIIVALGKEYAGLFTNDDDFANQLIKAGRKTGEKVWMLPMSSEYDAMLKSDIADFKNIGAGEAGSIVAAQFLKRFVEEGVTWAHIDIAGSAHCDRAKYDPSIPKGASGFGVRVLNKFIKDNIEK
ncbi:MAG: Cytosol aminopeptidase [Alphaproteobacteria bacterium ADurb.Bin438]|nr:MAG: Cytosol aminopeptidase [Alphaproteobacteria bacterium ADurb.Bin438]